MMEAFLAIFKSRRFILAIVGAVYAGVAKYFGTDTETVALVLGPIVTMILGESYKDAKQTPDTVNAGTVIAQPATPLPSSFGTIASVAQPVIEQTATQKWGETTGTIVGDFASQVLGKNSPEPLPSFVEEN